MRIVMTIPGLEQTSGVSVFCVETANTLAAAGHNVSILCKSHFAYLPDSRVRLVRDSSLAALRARPDVVHVHAIWSIFCIRAMAWSLFHHVPFVFSPHGGLMPRVFQKGRLKKWLFWHLVAKHFVKRAAAIHCTSEAEREACEKLGLKGPFVIAPLGVKLPVLEERSVREERLNMRANAEKKVEEWLSGVDDAAFVAALENLIDEKVAAGEYLFDQKDDIAKAMIAAKNFFDGYSRRLIELSDGRCVYFAPDPRSRLRSPNQALCWAEYAFHAVSSGGDKIPGKNYTYRKYNSYKVLNTDLIEPTLRAERCVPVLRIKPIQDAVKFFGAAHLGGLFDVVVRLDEFGNANANMTEVTFEASTKRRQKKSPQLVSLTEAIRTVVSHQTATGTYPSNANSIALSAGEHKGGDLLRTVLFLGRLGEEKGLLNLLEAWRQILEEVQSSKLKVQSSEFRVQSSEFRVQSSEFKVQCSKVDGGGNTELSTLNFKLILAGPDWLGYKKVLDAKIAAEHIENVEFTGPVQGAEKDRLYREADIFVLPSPMENFSMVVLEALAYGLPVIATKGTPWSEIEGNPDLPSTVDLLSRPTFSSAVAAGKCGCWIDQGVEPLKQALSRLLNAQPSTLNLLGANGRALAARRYQWPAISDRILMCYREISDDKQCRRMT